MQGICFSLLAPKTYDFGAKVKGERIFTLNRLVSALNCSSRTAQAKLKLWQTYTSYNQNGRFYSLPEVPKFDRYGLWRYKDAAFSKHGNLKKTIIHLVGASPEGLTGRELGELLRLRPQSFLHHFRKCPGIFREKHDGVYVYFSDIGEIYEKQERQRCALIHHRKLANISDSEAILILTAIIRHHGITSEDIMTLPEIKKSKIGKPAIQNFMVYHGLEKKILGLPL